MQKQWLQENTKEDYCKIIVFTDESKSHRMQTLFIGTEKEGCSSATLWCKQIKQKKWVKLDISEEMSVSEVSVIWVFGDIQ